MEHRPVKQLPADTARKIAAGEVIDRPCAIVRELMDNAVDSGADSISVEIENGGIDKIRISDNGTGMTPLDLAACARPHATSKISDADDLLNLTTLGFRGEALSSIAAVGRLTISSGTSRMRCSITEDHIIEPCPPVQNEKGTIVMSEGLFENFPARRLFLKRPGSESMMCRETFIEKALPRTDISFRLTIDGFLRSDLPKDVTLAQRFVRALELKEDSSLFNEISGQDTNNGSKPDWSFKLVIGEPSVYRSDRKQLFIYVNGRRVQEYSMMQAIEYGCQGFFPNGTHPVAALFIQMNPSLVDFNIHPAKKEVRFKDSASLHHGVSSITKAFFRNYAVHSPAGEKVENEDFSLEKEFDFASKEDQNSIPTIQESSRNWIEQPAFKNTYSAPSPSSKSSFATSAGMAEKNSYSQMNHFKNYESNPYKADSFANDSLAVLALSGDPEPVLSSSQASSPVSAQIYKPMTDEELDLSFKYVGNTLGTFLLAQIRDTLYFIDQHAAHERILFDRIMNNGGEKQNLLIPYSIETYDEDDDRFIDSIKEELDRTGFHFEKQEDGKWEVSTIPVRWTGTQEDLMTEIIRAKKTPKDIMYKIAAMTACKAAVKDGYILDAKTSEELCRAALKLPDPHCPHGRPVWTTLSKEQLFEMVRRTR